MYIYNYAFPGKPRRKSKKLVEIGKLITSRQLNEQTKNSVQLIDPFLTWPNFFCSINAALISLGRKLDVRTYQSCWSCSSHEVCMRRSWTLSVRWVQTEHLSLNVKHDHPRTPPKGISPKREMLECEVDIHLGFKCKTVEYSDERQQSRSWLSGWFVVLHR